MQLLRDLIVALPKTSSKLLKSGVSAQSARKYDMNLIMCFGFTSCCVCEKLYAQLCCCIGQLAQLPFPIPITMQTDAKVTQHNIDGISDFCDFLTRRGGLFGLPVHLRRSSELMRCQKKQAAHSITSS